MKLSGRRALITGASQGLGLAIARRFLEEGADLFVCARTQASLARARDELAAHAPSGRRVLAKPADVSKPEDARDLVAAAVQALGGLDILVCNAGVYGPKGGCEETEWNEWAQAFEINFYGTVLVCREALRHLKAQKYGKIILLSGGGATKPLPFLSAYAASKAAVVRWGETLAEEVRSFGIDVNAIAPGALNTRLLDEVLAAGPEKVGQEFYAQSLKQKENGGAPLERGASLSVFLASKASDGITGKLISALWDPWEHLDEHREDLKDSDIYTLRRIVPKERGKGWGGQ